MGAFLRPLFKPLIRFVVGMIAIPLFRLFLKRVVRVHELDQELEKDLEQWFRGSLLLLVATANMEEALFGWIPIDFGAKGDVIGAALRLMLAIGVTEAMPDQELFSILHPGPPKLSFPKGRRWQACREQCWPLLRGILCQHLNRSSQVFAILAAVFVGPAGWVCYGLAISQYLIIGLVTSKDKVLDVLSEFDKQVERRRQWLLDELQESAAENEGLPIAEAALRPAVSRQPANSPQPQPADHGAD